LVSKLLLKVKKPTVEKLDKEIPFSELNSSINSSEFEQKLLMGSKPNYSSDTQMVIEQLKNEKRCRSSENNGLTMRQKH